MKRRIVIFAILLTLSILFGIEVVGMADANPIPWAFNPQMTIFIQSPQNGTINSLPVLVNFTSRGDNQFSVSNDTSEWYARSFFYVIDGQNMENMGMRFAETSTTIYENGTRQGFNFEGKAYLRDLTDGPHSITVYYGAVNSIILVGTPLERIVFNPAWQATSQFYVNSKSVNPVQQVIVVMNYFFSIAAILATLIALIGGLLVYFKRRRRKI
jgi:hypothetical protein